MPSFRGPKAAMVDEAAIEVVYALPERQYRVSMKFEPGLTAIAAVERSGLLERFAEIAKRPLVLGIYGKPVEPEHRLAAGDRVEICRPLQVEPREQRRHLAAEGRVMGSADSEPAADVKK